MQRRAFLGLAFAGSALYAQRSRTLHEGLLAELDQIEAVNTQTACTLLAAEL